MTVQERIGVFASLGEIIRNLTEAEFDNLAKKVENNNNWFTPDQTRHALNAIGTFLGVETLRNWTDHYDLPDTLTSKVVGIMMAGNVPAVGFHDLLCVILSGHRAAVKLSGSDQILVRWLVDQLQTIDRRVEGLVTFEEMLKGKDAYIATGSDNSARYFDYYFGKYPHIIRKNRTSVAILDGKETQDDLQALGKDVFQYFGMGCRNVSKLFIKEEEDLKIFLDGIEGFHLQCSHHKYLNNYDYNKSIFLINMDAHLDNGFLLLKESPDLVSPIAVLFYEYYEDVEKLELRLSDMQDKIQCVVSRLGWYRGSVQMGNAQCPSVDDYADGVDTIRFLSSL